MDPDVADLLGIDLEDPDVARETTAINRDMDFIHTLVEMRRRMNLTQTEVAERMGCSQPAVSDFERLGGDPHLSTIRRYAHAVGAAVEHVAHVDAGRFEPACGWSQPASVVSMSAHRPRRVPTGFRWSSPVSSQADL